MRANNLRGKRKGSASLKVEMPWGYQRTDTAEAGKIKIWGRERSGGAVKLRQAEEAAP